ncbi:cytochrome P450 [Mycena belliarum]|uniref:Cytochrome P450 n=1 Tax=Mycena belliarum TaxID=1033014 RepID=A0AAD6XT35_9AGAR|nr:cytochrome P450 [Mycena belliae]KAJ7090901.1 cytochrome P450 [Mycena belliae]
MSALVLLAALTCHLFFKRYEPTNVPLLAGLLVVPPPVVMFLLQNGSLVVFKPLLRLYTLYYSGLLLSILTYRTSPLHPLWKYPGPVACKISKLWLTFISSQGKLHLYVKQLHDQYGPVVRIGPNEISISEVSLLPNILGANGMPKGPLWQGRRISGKQGAGSKEAARGNLIGSRDLKLHAEARKAWNRAFNPAAIKGYEPILIRRVAQLTEALSSQKEEIIDLSQWLSFFSFDFMGDIAFGGGLELMRDGDREGLWHMMERGLYLPSLTQHIPWSTGFLPYLPRVGQEMKALGKFAFDQAKRRLEAGSLQNDLFYHLMDEKRVNAEPYPFPLVVSNTVLAIVAGSDTSATVLANTFFLLLSHSESYKRLQLELEEVFPLGTTEPTDAAKLSNLPYLNAVIKESMRIFPPVATSLQRAPTIGSGTKVLGDKIIIPEGTSVVVPPYTMHHDPRYFSPSPENYMPERWLAHDDPKFIVNEDAFIPFSVGPANCAGRSLAMLEIRMVVAFVMQTFEMQFADGYDKQCWEADLKDYFVMQKGSLPIIMTSRNPR